MPYFIVLAAGIFIGRQWGQIKKAMAPYVGNAAEQFDAVYSQLAQKAGQRYEDFEDRLAEQRYRAAAGRSQQDGK